MQQFPLRFLALLAILFSCNALTQELAAAAVNRILIKDVRPWNGVGSVAQPVNILVEGDFIVSVAGNEISAPPDTITINGAGRIVMGEIEVGAPANLLVVEGNPEIDITVLAGPSSSYLVVQNGLIQYELSNFDLVETVAEQSNNKSDLPWYAYSNERFSIAFAGGVLMDYTSFGQDQNSHLQLGDLMEFNTGEVRAVRFGLGGQFGVYGQSWKYLLVGANRAFDKGFDTTTEQEWLWYDWSIGIPVFGDAELKLGKQKENFSHDRLTLLTNQQFMERGMELDGLLPSRNTGVTLANNALDGRMTWSVGAFTNMFGDRDDPFKESDQYITRITGLPYISDDKDRIFHVGGGYRYSNLNSETMRFRASPEVYFSPDFVDTGAYKANSATWIGLEAGWLQGAVYIHGEYVGVSANSDEAGNPNFKGYHVTAAWALTGESRGYDNKKGVFTKLIPNQSVIHGGPGAFELVARYSTLDLSDSLIQGGEMDRWSIGINWYASPAFKATAQYGWIGLDRFGQKSTIGVFQFRMNFLLGL